MSPWVAVTVCPAVGRTGRSPTATFLRGRLSTVTTMCRTMFCGTRNCPTGLRPSTPASESCTSWSLSARAGSAAVPVASLGIGCEIAGAALTGAGAGADASAAGAAARCRAAYHCQPQNATTTAVTAAAIHTTLLRAAFSRSSSHMPGTSPCAQKESATLLPFEPAAMCCRRSAQHLPLNGAHRPGMSAAPGWTTDRVRRSKARNHSLRRW